MPVRPAASLSVTWRSKVDVSQLCSQRDSSSFFSYFPSFSLKYPLKLPFHVRAIVSLATPRSNSMSPPSMPKSPPQNLSESI